MNDDVFEDMFNLICGNKIGEGIHRKVFGCRIRDDLVVKVEDSDAWRSFANVNEMRFWNDYRSQKAIRDWLAPCEYLSPDGRILLQKKCDPLRKFDYPTKLPSFLTDLKPSNFGIYEGRIVCVDYASVISNASTKLKSVSFY